MAKTLSHYRQTFAEKGFVGIISGRLRWYSQAIGHSYFLTKNWCVGRFVELAGNNIVFDGINLSVDNPLIKTGDKGPMYFGVYEISERKLTRRYIDPSLPTVEIGGSIGGVACITNRLLRDPSAHVVVECNPLVLPTLQRNKEINGCGFAIEPYALAYQGDTVPLNVSSEYFMMSRLHASSGHKITVGTIKLRDIVEKYEFNIINLISDSEGSEVEMVENEPDPSSRQAVNPRNT
jgi:FkbM family methyltransferase